MNEHRKFFFSQNDSKIFLPLIIVLHWSLSWASSVCCDLRIPHNLMYAVFPRHCCRPLRILPSYLYSYTVFGIRVSFIQHECPKHLTCIFSVTFVMISLPLSQVLFRCFYFFLVSSALWTILGKCISTAFSLFECFFLYNSGLCSI